MIYRFSKEQTIKQLIHQLNNFYLIDKEETKTILNRYVDDVMFRVEKCFSNTENKYYSRIINGKKETYFDSLHSCQWFIFLYYFSNTIYKKSTCDSKERILCDQIYGLSKTISGADLYYEVEMPSFFTCDHPVGTVIGRAKYGEGFSFCQGNTIWNNHGIYPMIGKNVVMMSNSKIIGNCKIGNNVIVAANTYIKDEDIPDNSIVFGVSPNLIIKKDY